jgi:hypothetical protein
MITNMKIALSFAVLIGLVAFAIGGLDSSGGGTGAAVNAESDGSGRIAPVSSVCTILYPAPCAFFERW